MNIKTRIVLARRRIQRKTLLQRLVIGLWTCTLLAAVFFSIGWWRPTIATAIGAVGFLAAWSFHRRQNSSHLELAPVPNAESPTAVPSPEFSAPMTNVAINGAVGAVLKDARSSEEPSSGNGNGYPPHQAELVDLLTSQTPVELIGSSIIIGSAHNGVHVSLDSASVDDKHAVFTRDGVRDEWTLATLSLRAATATRLNGKPVPPPGAPSIPLRHGDQIEFGAPGEFHFQIRYTGAPSATAATTERIVNNASQKTAPTRRLRDPAKPPYRMGAAQTERLGERGAGRSPSQAPTTRLPRLQLHAAGETSPGGREFNNDVHFVSGNFASIASVVKQGENGSLAARTIRSTLSRVLPTQHLKDVVGHVDAALVELTYDGRVPDSAAALDAIALEGKGRVVGAHIGDNRVYRLNTTSAGLLELTDITRRAAREAGWIGTSPREPSRKFAVSRWEQPALPGDLFVMVTQGFLAACGEDLAAAQLVSEVAQQSPDATSRALAEKLVRSALKKHNEAGDNRVGQNITAVVARVSVDD